MGFYFREDVPGHWQTELDKFQKILVLRCLRADKVTNAMQDFVSEHLGQRFIEPQVTESEICVHVYIMYKLYMYSHVHNYLIKRIQA